MRLFDWHCDTLTECEKHGYSLVSNPLHWDFERAKRLFKQAYQMTAVYIPDEINEQDAWDYFGRILSFLQRQDVPVICTKEAFSTHSHGIMLAVENSKLIDRDLDRINRLATFGVMYMTVTWNGSNLLGNGSLSGCADGLTAFGKSAVSRMYDVGILPDVSHLNRSGFWDVVELADGRPFLATHSDADAVHSHLRNLTDEQFCAIRDHGGLVGLNACAEHLGAQTFEQLERHLVHYLELGGEKTVVMGLDLDGMELAKWDGIGFVPSFYEYLLTRGYAERTINALFFENSQAFFAKTLTLREKCIKI